MKKYRIREGSPLDILISGSPLIFLLIITAICSAITGTY